MFLCSVTSKDIDRGSIMRKSVQRLLTLTLISSVLACGEDIDPNAPFACESYDPSKAKTYEKPTTSEEARQFGKCVPQKAGIVMYHAIEKPALMVKLNNSRKMMQLKFSVMTNYDQFAEMRVRKNDTAIRAAFNERMLMISEEDTNQPGFRSELKSDLKNAANEVLRKIEGYDFDLVDEVLITSYVIE